jgi:hypothetical protein
VTSVCDDIQVIEEVEEEVEEEEDIPLPYLSSDDGELSPVQPHRPTTVAQSKKFASLSALEGRPSRPEEVFVMCLRKPGLKQCIYCLCD